MPKRFFTALTTSVVLSFASSIAWAEGVVKVYNWSDYIDEDILSEFTAETGIELIYDVFDSNDVLETKLLAGKSGYDVVVPSASFMARQIQAGVYQKLDPTQLPNLKNMWDAIQQRTAHFDPDNAYSVNYMWGTTGIGYNVDAVQERLGVSEITSWDVLFTPEILAKLADCGVHVLDAGDEIFPTALHYMGKDPNSKNKKDYKEATKLLEAIRPHISKFHSSEYISALANGDICLAVGWSGDVFQDRDRADESENGVQIAYSAPQEGAMLWFDQLAIPKDADNVENAHVFINYLMRPDVMAKASNYVYYANGNLAAQALLEEDLINDPNIYPSADTMANMFVHLPYDPKTQRVVTRAWTKIKSAR